MTNRKVILKFIVGVDDLGNNIYKKRTIKNVRPEVSDDQIREYVERYCSLTSDTLVETVVVDSRVLEEEDEFIPEAESFETEGEEVDAILEEKVEGITKLDDKVSPEKESLQGKEERSESVSEKASPQGSEKNPEEVLKKTPPQGSEKNPEEVVKKASPQRKEKIPEKAEGVAALEADKGSQKQFIKPFAKKRMNPPLKRGSKTSKKKRK